MPMKREPEEGASVQEKAKRLQRESDPLCCGGVLKDLFEDILYKAF